jgi:uncharacterized membrane protein YgcG
MKKAMQTITLLVLLLLFKAGNAQVSVNVNIGAQPLWGPVGYDYVEYYYMPQYDVYYYVPTHRFVYFNGGKWLFATALPPTYGPVDFYSTYKVVINQPKAYMYHNDHKVKYVKYKGGGFDQVVIKNSKEPKYYVVKGHPSYAGPAQIKKGGEVKMKTEPAHKMQSPGPGPSHGAKPSGGGHSGAGGHGGGGGKSKGKGH